MFFIEKRNIESLIWIPILISIASFILYFKYLFSIKNSNESTISALVLTGIYRYRNIAIFSLTIGIFMILIKNIINYINLNKEYREINKSDDALKMVSVNRIDKNEAKKVELVNNILDKKIINYKCINDKNIRNIKKAYNHIKIISNMIITLLCIILILLISIEIRKKSDINRKNLNIQNKTADLSK